MFRRKVKITPEQAIAAGLILCEYGEVNIDGVLEKVRQKAEAKASEARMCLDSEKATIARAGELYQQEIAAATKKRDDAFKEAEIIGNQGDVLKNDSEKISAALAMFKKK